jgi:thiamine-monophosphate kinase
MDSALTARLLGEERLLQKILSGFPSAPPDVICGPGDDCAVLKSGIARMWSLLKCDSVIEGVHFTPSAPLRKVGWKALCRAISDVAAMGGTPRFALVTLHAPGNTPWIHIRELYRGIHHAGKTFGVAVVGGETCSTPGPLTVSVTLTGSVLQKQCVLRSGASPGDWLCVSGRLGGSLESGRHLTFTPRVREARWLVQHFKPTAMMDLSDGMAADLPRLARASACGVRLNEDAVPRHRGVSLHAALNDGEDFELLFTVAPRRWKPLEAEWNRQFPKTRLSCIGVMTPSTEGCQPANLFSTGGYHHFEHPRSDA